MIVHDEGAYHRAPVVDGWMREVLDVWECG